MKKIFNLMLIMVAIIFVGCGESQAEVDVKPNPTVQNSTPIEKPVDQKPIENFKPVVVSIAGDCTLGSFLGAEEDFEYYWQYGADYFFQNVKPIFAADDITFVNLEGPLTSHPQEVLDKQFPIRGEPKYVEILKAGSVEICNLSNNHIYDCGQIGFQDTIDNLKANDIKYCGEGFSDVIDVRGMKIGFLGYQGWYDTDELREQIAADIKKLRNDMKAEVIIVEFHWGVEKDYIGLEDQRTLARATIDRGADVVVGSHAHVVQGIEIYNGKPIAYGLANFCFGANTNPSDKDTFIMQTIFDRRDGKIVTTVKIIPCRISSTSEYNDFCPTPVEGYDAERVFEKLAESSKIFQHTLNFQSMLLSGGE